MMEFLIKILVYSVLLVGTFGRTLLSETNISNHSEGDSYNNCSCNWRYFKHYEVKGCTLEARDSCGCPKKFNCVFNNTLQSPSKVCIYQNKEYKAGSKIITSNDCTICRCHEGIPPYISCRNIECPPFEYQPGKKCHLIYNEHKCCPVRQKCVDNENGTEVNNETFTCEYNGQFYPLGTKIYPIDDPCQICLCNENWSGTNNISCYQMDCMFEKKKAQMNEGCIPVYHENKCCPIEFYCPYDINASYSIISDNETVGNMSESDELCIFDGQSYQLGTELVVENPCVNCSCLVPPDFTCVHQSCPSPPSYENCFPIFNPYECCPAFDCLYGDAEPFPDGCPTPLCADSSCHIETPPGHECPTCICDDRVSNLEHNTAQQVQQIGQNFEPFQDELEGSRQVDDYSEEELQLLPIRTQESEDQSPTFEKVIMAEPEIGQIPEESYNEEETVNSTVETGKNIEIENMSTVSYVYSESNNNSVQSNSSETEKNIQKRSGAYPSVYAPLQQENTFIHQGMYGKNTEREFESSDKNLEDFDDELESFKNKVFHNNGTVANEITHPTEAEIVPPGCPTPMCEGPWCKVGIPVGEMCPTCICRRDGSEP